MNRAERRRQKKLAAKTGGSTAPSAGKGSGDTAIRETVNRAVQFHQSGRLQEAQALYREVLEADPDQPYALHLLGVLAHQTGNNDIALELISRAVTVKSDYAEAFRNLGLVLMEMGLRDEAVARYRDAVAVQPDFAEAHFSLGVALAEAGEQDEAIGHYRAAVAVRPGYAEAHNNLGAVLKDEGRFEEAEACFRAALDAKPDYAEAQNNLGEALRYQGYPEQAVECYRSAVASAPRYAEAHNNLGVALKELGRGEEAEACFREALSVKPDLEAVHGNLGDVLREAGRYEEALASYRKVLEITPDMAEAHFNVANVLHELGRMEEAVAAYREALSLDPGFAKAHNNLGVALRDAGDLDEAVASCRRAIALDPEYAEAHNNLGVALKELGLIDAAIASYRDARTINPTLAEAHGNLIELLEKANRVDEMREALDVARRDCPDHPRITIGDAWLLKREGEFDAARKLLEAVDGEARGPRFSALRASILGDLCDRLGDTEVAMTYFEEANRLSQDTPQAKQCSGKAYHAWIDLLSKRFTPEWVKSWDPVEIEDGLADPAFLVGFPRSGTTLLGTILGSHGEIATIDEKPTMHNAQKIFRNLPGGFPNGLSQIDSGGLAEFRRRYFAEVERYLEPDERAALLVDKMPLNMVKAGILQRLFPEARFLFALRHPCDCVLSCFMQNFEPNDAMVNFFDLEEAARLYDKVMTLWLQYQEVLPLAVHTVRYETLVSSFEETVGPMLDFLGLEWDEGVLDYAETARKRGKINTPSYNQVTQPLYTRARGRWERYREKMEPVLPILLPWAERFGYET